MSDYDYYCEDCMYEDRCDKEECQYDKDVEAGSLEYDD